MCLKEYYFPDCWKVSSMVLVFENLWERSMAKNYHLVILLSVASKIFEKLANNRLVDNLRKYGLFIFFSVSDLLNQMQIFWQFLSFNRCRARHFTIWSQFHNLKSYDILCQVFSLISPFVSYRHLQVVLDGKSSQKIWDDVTLSPASITDLAFFLL